MKYYLHHRARTRKNLCSSQHLHSIISGPSPQTSNLWSMDVFKLRIYWRKSCGWSSYLTTSYSLPSFYDLAAVSIPLCWWSNFSSVKLLLYCSKCSLYFHGCSDIWLDGSVGGVDYLRIKLTLVKVWVWVEDETELGKKIILSQHWWLLTSNVTPPCMGMCNNEIFWNL